MRRARAWLCRHGEFALAAGLFLVCAYGAVFFICAGEISTAMYAGLFAYGFAVPLMNFVDAARGRRFMRMDERAEDLEGN